VFPVNNQSDIIQYNKGDIVTWNGGGKKIKCKITAVYQDKWPYDNEASYQVEGISHSLISHCDSKYLSR